MRTGTVRLIVALAGLLLTAPQASAQDWIYPFAKGDTLWSLCLEHSNKPGCWLELGRYNRIVGPRQIAPGTLIRIPVAWLATVPEVATVAALQGDVRYDAKSNGDFVAAAEGQTLLLGSTLVTGSGSVTLRRDDGSVVLLRPGTVLHLDSASVGSSPGGATELSVDEGEIEVQVPPGEDTRFEVRTPSAIAAVRGTQYRLATLGEAGETTRGEVLKGAVSVAAGSATLVEAGFGVLARKGEPIDKPRQLLAAPVFPEPSVSSPLPLQLNWTTNPDAASWRVDIYRSGAAGALLATRETTVPQVTFANLKEACYRVVVRGVDSEGFNGLQNEIQACVEPPPPVVEDTGSDLWPAAAVFGTFLLLILL